MLEAVNAISPVRRSSALARADSDSDSACRMPALWTTLCNQSQTSATFGGFDEDHGEWWHDI
jgi:hypothetical protein